jgi:hypothetical protein
MTVLSAGPEQLGLDTLSLFSHITQNSCTTSERRAILQCNIQFKNESPHPIHVVMDTWREQHPIPPAGQATFHPNVGDNPTYHVWAVDPTGKPTQELYSDSFSTVWVGGFPPLPHIGGDLKWTGAKIDRQ